MKRLAAALFLLPLIAHAQLLLPGFSGAVRMSLSPENPEPGTTVLVTLESGLVDLSHATVAWYVDGKRIAAEGSRVSIPLGRLGTQTDVSAQITTSDGSIVGAETTITPTSVDLLYDTSAYVPPFYEGRALPSAGSSLRVYAMAHFTKPDGTELKPADIIYTWKRGGQVMGSQSGRGRDVLVADAPYLFGSDVISLAAESADGLFTGGASITVRSVEPVLRLYEDHPLFGLRLGQALASTTRISEREMTFALIPFFATVRSPADASLQYDWTVNGSPVNTSADAPHELALGAQEGGSALMQVSLTQSSNIFFDAQGSWRIVFDSSAAPDLFTGH
jgi:hypothetical protein